jgi:type III restriction enzyme
VEPVLVIQVEDGSGKQLSKTNIDEIVKVVERVAGKLPDAAWAHAFQDDSNIEAAGHSIRKIDASKIENDGAVRIVLFKMSLSTGWDCPRAEVLMSFRRALDHTLIAQLVGRMVRTPLARNIEGSDLLNSVGLFLPHYDATGLRKIIDDLSNPDPESGIPVDVQDGASLLRVSLDSKQQKCVERYQQLPSYRVERVTKISNVRRLVRFARYLAGDEIDVKELDTVKELIVKALEQELVKLKKNATFIGNLAANEEIEVRETWVGYGFDDSSPESKTIRIKATEENIEDLFSRCSRTLGEGLHMEFWRSRQNEKKPLQSKLELVGLLMEEKVLNVLEELCGERLQTLQRKHDEAIRALGTAARERYNALRRIAKEPESENLLLPPDMEIKDEGEAYEGHLYKDERGKFHAVLNKWEAKVVRELIEGDKSVIAWLRLLPRKDWALCIPYEQHNERHPLYPDIVAFRKTKNGIIVDILDPHGTQLDDAVEKAKGLAAYARKHGTDFGRIDLIIVDGKNKLKRLNLNDESVRERVDMVTSREHLVDLLNELS